jgi:drug/metabolite transporter (DMT)-like permease
LTETIVITIAVLVRILSNPLANVFQKKLTVKGVQPLVINFISYLLLAVGCLVFVFKLPEQKLPFTFWIYSILAGVTGAFGNGFLVKALKEGDLSVLGPVNSYKAVIGVIVGIFLLGEIPNLWGLLGIGLIIWGSYFVLDTTEARFSWALLKQKAIQYRIWALLLTAIEAVLIKKIILSSSVAISFVSWCWTGALFSFLLLPLYGLPVRTEMAKVRIRDIHLIALLVICIGLMQYTTNYVFDHIPVGYALSLFQLSIIVSVLLGYHIFKETSIKKKLLGSVIMIAGSVLIVLMKS